MNAFVKMQARIRGMLARKDYQKVRADMNMHGGVHQSFDPDNMVINYDNQRVADIRSQLGNFDYTSAEISGISTNLQSREETILPDNQAKYVGQWIKGQSVREGQGK